MIGYIATVCTTSSVIPGLYRAWKTKSAGDLSLYQLWLLQSGIVLWLIYGITTGQLPVILANSISTILNGFLIGLRYKYGSTK